MLCDACLTALTFEVEPSIEAYPLDRVHHVSRASAIDAIAKGCFICCTVAEELLRAHGVTSAQLGDPAGAGSSTLKTGDKWTGASVFTSYFLDRGDGHWQTGTKSYYLSISLDSRVVPLKGKASNVIVAFAVESEEDIVRAGRRVESVEASDVIGDERTWALLHKWHDECKASHRACNAAGGSGFVPTRLVDFSSVGKAEQGGNVVVLETKGTKVPGRYVTLSHRWGTDQTIKLLKSNLSSFRKGIPTSSLPQKYRDAFVVAAQLEAQHIWIDSLCIIQDDRKDWARESGLMSHVYANSACNIAVTGASDGAEGCFRSRNPVLASTCSFTARVHGASASYHVSLHENLTTRLSRQPLLRRAWVVQERLLSPRTIHFGADQIYWKCRAVHACESRPSMHPSDDQFQAFRRLITAKTVQEDAIPALLKSWDLIVQQFTSCDLTKASDKLIAMSGLAKTISQYLGAYNAGLWRVGMLTALLWHKTHRGADLVRYDGAYIAPTWSWASVRGAVIVGHFKDGKTDSGANFHDLADIIEVSVEPADGDVTGALKGGYLKIKGGLVPATFTDDAWWRKQPPLKGGEKYSWCDLGDPKTGPPGLDFDVLLDAPVQVGGAYWCLPMVGTGSIDRKRGNTRGLILKRSSRNPLSKTYVRVGTFSEAPDDYETRFWWPQGDEVVKII